MDLTKLFTAFIVDLHSIKITIRLTAPAPPVRRGVTIKIRSANGTFAPVTAAKSPSTANRWKNLLRAGSAPSAHIRSFPVSNARANVPVSSPVANSAQVRRAENSSHAPRHHRPGRTIVAALSRKIPTGACPCAARELDMISR